MLRIFLLVSLTIFAFCASAATSKTAVQPSAWQDIKHIVIIVLENQPGKLAEKQTYLKTLIEKGAYLKNFYAITHPSQPNYIAMTAGSQRGVTDNHNVVLNTTHIGNLLNDKGLSWKVYAEGLPGPCSKKSVKGSYARRHVPFLSYKNILENPTQCRRVVEGEEFFKDIEAKQLPHYAFYIPNNDNNGHDTGIAHADHYMETKFASILSNPDYLKDTLFVITFDEDDGGHDNKVYTVLLGDSVKVGMKSDKKYNLYSLLRTVEAIYDLGTLGRKDSKAKIINDVWVS